MSLTTFQKPSSSPSIKLRNPLPDISLRPHPNEASIRLRNSTTGLLAVLLLLNLLPLPSPLTAFNVLSGNRITDGEGGGVGWLAVCATELGIMALLALNILQSTIAIRYPRKPLPPLLSPKPVKGLAMSPPSATTKRRLGGLSPNTSPQRQFSFSSSSSYISSPISTPSRTLQYSVPSSTSPSSRFTSSLGSSGLSLPPTPSPVVSAYWGRHAGGVGRAFDESVLSQLEDDDED